MARRSTRATGGRKGVDPPRRRARAQAAGTAVGSRRKGLPVRHRRRKRVARRSVPRPFAAARLSLHVRARLHGGLSVVLEHRRWLQRHRRASRESRRSLYAVSRAPLAKLQAYKQRMGWTFPWASSFGGDFNFDFSVAFTELEQAAAASSTTIGASPRCPKR